VALTHRLARRLGFEPFEAWAASIVLLATGYFLKYANHAMFDVFLTALFLLTLLAYRRAWEGGRDAWVAAGVFTGLGVLTKSALGLLPLIVIAVHALWCGRLRRSLATGAWLVPIAAIAVVLPWYGYQLAVHHDAFLREHVAWLLVQRGLGTGVEAASPWSPFGYVRELALTYWPWLPAAVYGLWLAGRESFAPVTVYTSASTLPREWKPRDGARLLFAWPVVVIVLLSAAHEQKLWYAMSVFPALALASASALGTWLQDERLRTQVVLGGFVLAAAAGAFLALTPIGLPAARRPDIQALASVARSMVAANDGIAFGGGNYYSIAHEFVFYSDRTLLPGSGDTDGVRAALDRGRWALVDRGHFARLTGSKGFSAPGARYAAVAWAGDWALVCRAPAPPADVGPPPQVEKSRAPR
jgi:4-amino-4-deoxy-L-arabinose transferase-like glycosyltransferase